MIDIKDAIRALELKPGISYLFVFNPEFIDVQLLQEAMNHEEFKGIHGVAIASLDVNEIKMINLGKSNE